MIIKAFITGEGNQWRGECEAIEIQTNIAELKGQPVEFWGSSRQSVVDQIIAVLKSRGMSGKLRII